MSDAEKAIREACARSNDGQGVPVNKDALCQAVNRVESMTITEMQAMQKRFEQIFGLSGDGK